MQNLKAKELLDLQNKLVVARWELGAGGEMGEGDKEV